MVMKAGYKRTEVGVIPEDWEDKTFGETFTGFISGQTPSRSKPEYFKGNIPWITSGELNHGIVNDSLEKITEEAIQNTNIPIFPKGTFIFAIIGLDAEGTRGNCAVTGIDASINQSCMALLATGNVSTNYLFYYYEKLGNSLALRYCQGTKQQNYSGTIVRKLPIVFPKNPDEQQAITTALSDAAAFITSLDKVIAKKRDLKQAAMQNLLTGKQRLPGFHGKWVEKKLGEIGECLIGLTYKPSNVKSHGLLVLRSANIADGELRFEDNVFVDIDVPEKIIAKKDDILICVRNGSRDLIGKCALIDKKAKGMTFGAFMSIFRTPYNRFVFYQFQSDIIKKQIHEHLGATINQITNKSLNSFQIPFPNDEKEQRAIANVLSDMDAELAALEQKRDKTKAIKQGMMQELLTGRIRLIL